MNPANFTYLKFLPKNNSGNYWKALAILAIGFVFTLAATLFIKHDVETKANREFKLICGDLKNKIHARLHAQAQLLRSGTALFAASDTVTRSDWKEFYERSRIDKNLPGIQGFGFSLIIPKNQLNKYIRNIQQEGFPSHTIKPAGERAVYSAIIYLEPFSGRNLRAFGYDMLSEPVRRKAMEQSRDADLAMLSGKVLLVQETTQDVQIGTLMYAPVYKYGMPVNTIKQRRAAIKGWVYSPFHMNDLMTGILGRWDENLQGRIHLMVYDEYKSTNSLLFDSQKNDTLNHQDLPNLTVSLPVEFNGKKWILYFTQLRGQSPLFQGNVIIVFLSGTIICLLLFFLILSLFNTRYRALRIARQLTAELKESESRFTTMLSIATDGIHLLDEQGNVAEANPAFCRMLGYTRDELFKLNVTDWDAQWLPNELVAKIGELISHPAVFETTHRHKDGTCCDVEINAVGVTFDGRRYLYAAARDITDRKKSTKALNDSESHAHALISAIPDFMFMLNRLGVYIDYKAPMEELYYQNQSIIGKKNRDIMPPEFCDLIDKKIASTLQTGQMQVFEYELTMPTEGIREFEARMVPSGSDEVIALVRDITDRNKTVAELKLRNKQLIESNIEKDKFFSIISHDLRSPFNAFLGFTRIMVEELNSMTLEEIKKIVLSMRKSATNLYSLLENLLEWSMMQRGMIPFKPVFIPLALKITECMELIIGSAQKKEIGISYNIPDDLLVFADVQMVETLIRNLISNAVKFTSRGGKIFVSAKTSDGGTIEISVQDSGIGMSRAMVDNLFRLDGHTNRKGTEGEPSTGLGLIICKDLIEKNNGKIWVESEEAKGSTFRFTLPAQPISQTGEQEKNKT